MKEHQCARQPSSKGDFYFSFVHGQIFGPEGEVRRFVSAGTWRKSGHHKWEIKHIPLAADGQRMFVVDDFDLVTRSTNGAVYALD